jgi:hypothetical protein
MLVAAVCGAILVMHGPDRAFAAALATLVATALAWILISVFWPSIPDRTCPACGRACLRRLEKDSTCGVACGACSFQDPDRSSFLFAEEEEGVVEPEVARERLGEQGWKP